MEIELEFGRESVLWLVVGAIALAALVGLGVLGRAVTPNPPHVLTWSDWRFLAVQREYRRELAALREDGQTLAALAKGEPSIETAWRAEEIAKRWQGSEGLSILAGRRQAVIAAAQAVEAWASGTATRQQAVQAVQHALERLKGE